MKSFFIKGILCATLLLNVGCREGCDNRTKSDVYIGVNLVKENEAYRNELKLFKDYMLDGFPSELDSNYIKYTVSRSPEAGLIRLDVIYKCSLCLDQYNDSSFIAIYNSNDTCLLIANRFASLDNYSFNIKLDYSDSLKIDPSCYEGKYPIPNFWHNDYTTDETECKLPEDFNIYVEDAKQGKYLSSELLTDGRHMPTKWKNGYSRGVAISEKRGIIIYWVIVW